MSELLLHASLEHATMLLNYQGLTSYSFSDIIGLQLVIDAIIETELGYT